jgi:1-acyl-sn-glycerol-3-phosphate acyltransferase
VRTTAFLDTFRRLLYGGYAWIAVAFVVAPTLLALAIAPKLLVRRRIAQLGARTIFRLIGSPISLEGCPITATHHAIVIANHASYLDGVILTAVLPTQFTFLIKQEMRTMPLVGFILRRLGSEFVDRADPTQRHRMGRRLVDAALKGKALAVFPEGTFDEQPGLKPFRAGAFRAAQRADAVLWPTVILGARQKFPASTMLPAPGPLSVHVCEPLKPADYESHDALMRAARDAMLEHLGEPDLDAVTFPSSEVRRPLQAVASECSEPDL